MMEKQNNRPCRAIRSSKPLATTSESAKNHEIKKQLIELHQRTIANPEFDKMTRIVEPFLNYFELNHFYYVKMFSSGHFTTLGTNIEFQEYALEHVECLQSFPYTVYTTSR